MESGTHSMHLAQANKLARPDVSTQIAMRSGDRTDPAKWEGGRDPLAEYKTRIAERQVVCSADHTVVEDDSIDIIHDFSIEDGDMLDLSEVAQQFGMSAGEMDAALNLRQTSRGVKVEVLAKGECHSLIIIRGVRADELRKAAPWILDSEGTTGAVTACDGEPLVADRNAAAILPEPSNKPGAERAEAVTANAADTLVLGPEQSIGDVGRDKLTDPDTFVFETKPRDVYRNDVLSFKASPNEAPDFSEIAKAFGLSDDEVTTTIDLSKVKPGLKVQLELDGTGHKVAATHRRDANEADAFPGALVV